jgi:hypothetical protein
MANLANFRIVLIKLKWFLYEGMTSVWDICLLGLRILPANTIIKNRHDEKTIVYVGEFLPPRIPRLAKWCKKSGHFSVLLLCHERGYIKKFSNEEIDQTLLFRNEWHLRRIIKSLAKPYVVHGFAPKSKYPYIAMKAFREIHPNVPFAADYQDVLSIYYEESAAQGWLLKDLPYEKNCMQYADGIVAHSLEPCEGMKVFEIQNKKRLFFPLYSDNDSFCTPNHQLSSDDIHLVYAGGIFGSHRDKGHYGGAQLHWLIDYLTTQKIHLHIYPSPSVQKADYEEYQNIARVNSFLHIHESVSQESLAQELSKYHYGLMPFFKENSRQSLLKYKYATTLKLFNYLEAGIPIIAGTGVVYQSWIVERYGLGISVRQKTDFADIRKLIGKEPYHAQGERVLRGRNQLSLQKHIPRLMKFYELLSEKVK